MTQTDIQSLLMGILMPILEHPQPRPQDVQKLETVLRVLLTQKELFLARDSTLSVMPVLSPPQAATQTQIETLAQQIFASIGARPPGEENLWMRERCVPFINTPLEPIGAQMIPSFSLGPLTLNAHDDVWYDFYLTTHQLAFFAAESDPAPYLVIHSPQPFIFPLPGNTFSLQNATLWINCTAICDNPAPANSYVPIRVKDCHVQLSIPINFPNLLKIVTGPTATLTLKCSIDALPVNDPQPGDGQAAIITLPEAIALQFKTGKGSFAQIAAASATLLGTELHFEPASAIRGDFISPQQLLVLPLKSAETQWGPSDLLSTTFDLSGSATIKQSGWYFQPVTVPPAAGITILGNASTAGYLGASTDKGLRVKWTGLDNGVLKPTSVLVVGGSGRLAVFSVHDPVDSIEQKVQLWQEVAGKAYFSLFTMTPAAKLPQQYLSDATGYEYQRLYGKTVANLDRPLAGNGRRLDTNLFGVLDTFTLPDKIVAFLTSVDATNTNDGTVEAQLQRLRNIMLENALLTVRAPQFVLVKGVGDDVHRMTAGRCVQFFPVHRIIHTLPDPYISSEPPEPHEPNDVVPPQIALLFAAIDWEAGTPAPILLRFGDNQRQPVIPTITMADKVLSKLQHSERISYMHPCQTAYNPILTTTLLKPLPEGYPAGLSELPDIDNLVGAFMFLQWFPGNISLVDVSGRAAQMGVAFSGRGSLGAEQQNPTQLGNTGYNSQFPFQLQGIELVSSGRLVRAFTLPQIQWEPLTYVENPLAVNNPQDDDLLKSLMIFHSNGAPTRIASGNKQDVALTPKKVVEFIHNSYYDAEKQHAAAAHFALPFGMCAVTYFKPEKDPGDKKLPFADLQVNKPDFNTQKYGPLQGGLQLAAQASYKGSGERNPDPYFHGSTLQVVVHRNNPGDPAVSSEPPDIPLGPPPPGPPPPPPPPVLLLEQSVLGRAITRQFNGEFFGAYNKDATPTITNYSRVAKVPLQRVDFSGYGASIFSDWQDKDANFGAVSQVQFKVMLGRTAHEVVQIKSVIIPMGIPVVRSVIMHRQNHALVTRYDTGWQPTGEGVFNYVPAVEGTDPPLGNPYEFHPHVVKGIYNVTNIRDTTITETLGPSLTGAGVYFDGNVRINNVVKGGILAMGDDQLVPSKGQFGYVLLADTSKAMPKNIAQLLSPADFQKFLLRTGPLGGPVDCVVKLGGTSQQMHIKRVEVAAKPSTPASPSAVFVSSANGTPSFSQQGAWSVVKCTNGKDIVQLAPGEMVPLFRKGKLTFTPGKPSIPPTIDSAKHPYALGSPADVLLYDQTTIAPGALSVQYAFLQTTPTHKLLFRRPLYLTQPESSTTPDVTKTMFTREPLLADSFCMLKSNNIFPSLDTAFNMPDLNLTHLDLSADNDFAIPKDFIAAFTNLRPKNLDSLNPLRIVDEAAFKIYIKYDLPPDVDGPFTLGLSAAESGRKPWELSNQKVSIVVEVGDLKPLLSVVGNFHSDADGTPKLESPELVWGDDNAIQCMVRILQVLTALNKVYHNDDATAFPDGINFTPSNTPDSWEYKCSIDHKIPVIQFPDTEMVTLSGPPPMIIEASLSIGIFFSLSLSPANPGLIKPSAGLSFTFEGMIQVELITIEIATAYAVGRTKVTVDIDLLHPAPSIDFTAGFGATVAVQLPVVGVVSITRTVSLSGSFSEAHMSLMAGTMLRGVLSLAGGLLMTSIQIEGSAGMIADTPGTGARARLELEFTLDVSLAFVISYDFTRKFTHEVPFSALIPKL